MRTKLIQLRKELGFTQYTLADALGISRSHYSEIESGEKAPSLDLALKIKKTLSHKDDDIFFDFRSPDTRPVIDKNKKRRRGKRP